MVLNRTEKVVRSTEDSFTEKEDLLILKMDAGQLPHEIYATDWIKETMAEAKYEELG